MTFEESCPNERLRDARRFKGWTQSNLAEAVDTDFETVSRWERGITFPSSYFRGKLCNALGKTAEELGFIAGHDGLLPTSPCVFLSSSYADAMKDVVMSLKADLQSQGFQVVSSRTVRRHAAGSKRNSLQEIIRAARVVLVITSPEARSSRHIQDALLIARMYRRPVYSVWIEGEHWQECMPGECDDVYGMIDARRPYDQTLLNEISSGIKGAWLACSDDFATSEPDKPPGSYFEPRNPYKGLNAYQYADRYDFFGRDALIDELANALETSLTAGNRGNKCARILAVVGPSGSGKSSAVMAGLLPRLREGGLPGSDEWIYLDPIVPGAHPIESLALALSQQLPGGSLQTIREELLYDSARGLHLLASAIPKRPGTRVVLFVDQFEELFTQTTTQEERQCFIDVLVTAITEPNGPLIAILTLRADFYDRPMHYQELGKLVQQYHKPVLPMETKELRTVIEQPARLPDVNLTFEGDLVGDLLFEVHGRVGALPLLQFTLDKLFQRRSGRILTLGAYREIGGVKGALAKHAESTYAELPTDEHRKLARALFLRLIDPGATEQDTARSRVTLDELALPDPIEAHILQETADAFISARLVTANTMAGVPVLEVSHEALIREWPRLKDWLHLARGDMLLQKAISEDAAEWIRRGRLVDRLYRGTQLDEAQAWTERSVPSIDEMAFLQSSIAEHERQKAAEQARRAREQGLHQRAAKRQRYVIGMMAVTTLVLVAALVLTLVLQRQLQTTLTTLQSSRPVSVTNLNDHGPGSLRQAIDAASPDGLITFAPGLKGTIKLARGELNIYKNLTIIGPVTVSGGNASGVFRVSGDANVTISNLTIENGKAVFGGGIRIDGGTLTLINSTVFNNVSDEYGGGIYNRGTLVITNSTISHNRAKGSGGGIDNSGSLELTNSTISNNSAISNNIAEGNGGGIDNSGSLKLTNSTISGNVASVDGGGINNGNGDIFIEFCTVYGNKAQTGGGIDTIGSYKMQDSIVAGDRADSGPDIFGTVTSRGYNLIQSNSGASFDPSTATLHSTDKLLSMNDLSRLFASPVGLRDNRGPTETYKLAPDSPAIDAIPRDECDQFYDQRGTIRPQGTGCDIGAYEYVPS